MSTPTLERPGEPPPPPGAAAAVPAFVAPARPRRTAPRGLLGALAVCALGAYALDRWLALVSPRPGGAVLVATLVALGSVLLVVLRSRIRSGAGRVAATVAGVLVAAGLVLRASGVPGRLLNPVHWPRLIGHVADGIGGLPNAAVPYDGGGATRQVIVLCGSALLVAAGVTAARPVARRITPLLALAVLFGVPAVQVPPDHPWLAGALFAVGLAVVLHVDRLSTRGAPLAAAAVGISVLAGALVAPHVRPSGPLVDLQALGAAVTARGGQVYRWNQDYRPLSWPRDGRVVLRVSTHRPAYWKAASLEDFDGTGWVEQPEPAGPDTQVAPDHPEWRRRIEFHFGRLRGAQFVGAGSTWFIDRAPIKPVAGTAGSLVTAHGVLGPGSSYRALVYTPRPTAVEMRAAGAAYPPFVLHDLSMRLPGPGGPTVTFASWPRTGAASELGPASTAVEQSPYGRMYALAQRLRARAATPYDYAMTVERFLTDGYGYDEAPPTGRYPLLTFLFSSHRGYCQHFSGTMALLLRMGGVPARVAAGFSPGGYSRRSHEWVVRDTDAHAWVEAYFPGIGWATFDPTPSGGPARDRFATAVPEGTAVSTGPGTTGDAPHAALSSPGPPHHVPGPALRHVRERAVPTQVPAATGDTPVGALVGAALGVLALLAGGLLLRRRWPSAPAPGDVFELRRALARAGRPARPGATLRDLERLLRDLPGAAGYLRALRASRYAGDGSGPTAADRRAMRGALAYGLGLRGRLRALYALPPRPGPVRPHHRPVD